MLYRHLDDALTSLRKKLLAMENGVLEMIIYTRKAIVDSEIDLAKKVIEYDLSIDRLEKEIDNHCMNVLALYEPKAIDLRFLVSVMKIVNDLERVGDCCVNISRTAIDLAEEPPLKPYLDLPRMFDIVYNMLKSALKSLEDKDSTLAREVMRKDDEVDALYHQLFRELITFMMEDPKSVKRALGLLLAARNLERIADHATNIAEDVIFYLEAKDVRHPKIES